MKIEEAKTKICPFTLYTEKYKDPIKTHIISYETKGSNCICDECMAWKFTRTHYNYGASLIELGKNEKEGYCKRITNERT